MTRKDYILIANVVKSIDDKPTRAHVALSFAERLGRLNERFNHSQFLVACGTVDENSEG